MGNRTNDEMVPLKTAMGMIDALIDAEFGPRCPDFEPECVTCQAWALRDKAARAITKDEGDE